MDGYQVLSKAKNYLYSVENDYKSEYVPEGLMEFVSIYYPDFESIRYEAFSREIATEALELIIKQYTSYILATPS